MPGVTNRGKYNILGTYFRNASIPGGGFALFLATSAQTPTPDTNLKTDLTEIATGNGYSAGGQDINRDTVDFDVLTEDDVNDRALTQLKDIVFTASGGTLPASGSGARWAVLTDRNATLNNREIITYWNLVSDRIVSDGQSISLLNCEIRGNEVP
ncbi:MAG TPA: hypothetical protein VNL14_16630 [Candidatus Acidoferrales bacterium]|nr:hypothetical protein [Candidatus Acidoferrales bacterium]